MTRSQSLNPPHDAQMHLSQQPAVSCRGTAAVIDGDKLLLTPLRHVVIPPPLAAVTARTSAPVDRLAFCDVGDAEVSRPHASHASLQ